MDEQKTDQKKSSIVSSIEQANARIADEELRQQSAKERYRAATLKRNELKRLAKEKRESPEVFALEAFI
ncbi:TPA: hypothetical protein UZ440_004548, partial [Escherichia coli]|nr:hypothetical protein [Escherichia coli]